MFTLTATVVLFVLLFLVLVMMAGVAPSPTARTTPSGIMLKDGYRATFTFSLDPDCSLKEVTITPGGEDLGDPIDQTTMWNDSYMTAAPQSLSQTGPTTIECAYDPAVLTELEAMKGVEQTGTLTWKDGSTYAQYGWVNSWEIGQLVIGTQPRMTITWHNSNFDPTNNVEAGPALASVAGT